MMSASFVPTAEMVDAVSEWHQRQADARVNRPLLPYLRDRFGLDNVQAVAVIREACGIGGANESGS